MREIQKYSDIAKERQKKRDNEAGRGAGAGTLGDLMKCCHQNPRLFHRDKLRNSCV